jgi:hypothetical protein
MLWKQMKVENTEEVRGDGGVAQTPVPPQKKKPNKKKKTS